MVFNLNIYKEVCTLPRGRARGFTMIELLVVLVIMGLISLMVAPRLAGTLENLQLRTSARKMLAALRYIRSQAVTEGKTLSAVFDLDTHRIFVLDKDLGDGGNPAAPGGEKADATGLRLAFACPEDIKLVKSISFNKETHGGRFQIHFYPAGGTSGGKVVVKGLKERRLSIEVNTITGAVTLNDQD